MATVGHPSIYDDLVDVLAKHAEPNELLTFQLSQAKQRKLDRLLTKNRQGKLTAEESAELDTFEQFEHVVRLLKARLRAKGRK